MKKIFAFFTIICLIVFIVTGSASADKSIRYRNAKTLGLGDAKVAGGFDYNGFVDNPALLSRIGHIRFSVINLPITFNKNVKDIYEFIDDNNDNFENYDDLELQEKSDFINDLKEHDSKWGRVNFAPMVDIAVNLYGYGVGLAIFNSTELGVKPDTGIYEPRVWGEGYSNTAIVLGISRPVFMLYPGLTVGANFKYLNRRRTDVFQIPASDLGNFQDTIDPINEKVKDQKHNTFAMDVGGLLELPFINTEIGASNQSIGDGRGSSVDIGIAKRMASNRVTILADYIDFIDNNKENIFRKIHIGAEYKVAVLALRAGLNSGYPTVGLGLNFKIIDIDAAYYTEELSKGPGGYGEDRYIAQLKFGW